MKNRKAILLLLVLAGAVYVNSLFSGFVWDDGLLIIKKQAFFSHPGNAVKIFISSDAPLGEKFPYYRPLNTFTYMMDHYLWGLHPFWYHLENVLLHAIVAVLFYILLLELFEDRRLAFLASVLFAVYPVNAEVVDLISARNTILCALFVMASLLFLSKAGLEMNVSGGRVPRAVAAGRLNGSNGGEIPDPSSRGGVGWVILSLVAYFLALLSKEPAVVLPFFLLSLRLTAREEKFKAKWNVLAGFFAVTAVYFMIRHIVLGTFTSKSGVEFSLARLKLIAAVYFEHFRLMLFPYHLNALYAEGRVLFSPYKAIIAITIAAILLYFSVGKKTPDPIRAGAQWILWGLLPVSNIVKIPSAPIAERYQYTVIFGFVLILGYLLAGLQKRKMLAGPVIAFALALALGARTFERNFVWHDNLSLDSSMVRSDPGNPSAHGYLGLTYEKQGMLKEAEKECSAAKELDPHYGDAYVCLGLVYSKQGRPLDALEEFQKAVKVSPDLYEARMNLAVAYMNINRTADAKNEFRTVVELDPAYAGAHLDLAELYLKQKNTVEAASEFQAVIKLDPDDARAHSDLGLIYAGQGNLDGAVLEFKTALAIDPLLTDTVMNLGVAYAREGSFENAKREFQTALKLSPANAQAIAFLNAIESRMNGR